MIMKNISHHKQIYVREFLYVILRCIIAVINVGDINLQRTENHAKKICMIHASQKAAVEFKNL